MAGEERKTDEDPIDALHGMEDEIIADALQETGNAAAAAAGAPAPARGETGRSVRSRRADRRQGARGVGRGAVIRPPEGARDHVRVAGEIRDTSSRAPAPGASGAQETEPSGEVQPTAPAPAPAKQAPSGARRAVPPRHPLTEAEWREYERERRADMLKEYAEALRKVEDLKQKIAETKRALGAEQAGTAAYRDVLDQLMELAPPEVLAHPSISREEKARHRASIEKHKLKGKLALAISFAEAIKERARAFGAADENFGEVESRIQTSAEEGAETEAEQGSRERVFQYLDNKYGSKVRVENGRLMVGEFNANEFKQLSKPEGEGVPVELAALTEREWKALLEQWIQSKEQEHGLRPAVPVASAEAGEPAPAVAEAAPAAAGDTPSAPERPPREPEATKKWIWTRETVKGVVGAGASAVGVKFFYDGVQYIREQRAKRKATSEVDALVKEIDDSVTAQMRTAAREGAMPLLSSALRAKVDQLVDEGKIAKEQRDRVLAEMANIVMKRARAEEEARGNLAQEIGKVLNDYLETKVSKARVAREFLNTAFVLIGLQLARGVTMLGLAGVERAAKARREYELSVRAARLEIGGEGREEKFWEREKQVWNDVFNNARKEYVRSLKLKGAKPERVSALARAMDFGKALGTTVRFLGIGYAVGVELNDEGVSRAIEDAFEKFGKEREQAILNNIVRNLQIYHVWPKGEDGHLEAPAQTTAAAAVETPDEAGEAFRKSKGVIEKLIAGGKAELGGTADGTKILEIGIGDRETGFAEVQQALRRVIGQEIKLPTDHFRDVDAERAEKMIKMLTHLLHHEKLPEFMFDKGAKILTEQEIEGIIGWSKDGDLLISDYDRFQKELLPRLEELEPKYKADLMAYVNDTDRRVWNDEIMRLRAQATGEKIAVDDFDKSTAVHKAEVRTAQQAIKSAGISGLEVKPEDVVNQDTFLARLGDRIMPVEDGMATTISTSWQGHGYAYVLPEPIDIHHPYAGDDLKDALVKADTAAVKKFGGKEADEIVARLARARALVEGGAAESPGFQLGRGPILGESRSLTDVLAHAAERHGQLQIGGVLFKAEWLEPIRDQSAGAFAKDPLHIAGLHTWEKWSKQGKALRTLAEVIKKHPDSGTLEDFAIKHEDRLDDWMREAKA